MYLNEQLKLKIVASIKKTINPELIFLFGSYANGTAEEDSDLDLLVVAETDKPDQTHTISLRMALKVLCCRRIYCFIHRKNLKNMKMSLEVCNTK